MPSMMKAPHSKGASCKMCGGGACKMAEGGEVKGVHGPSDVLPRGQSEAGYSARQGKSHPSDDKYQRRDNAENIKEAKGEHYRVLGEITSMKGKDRTNLAEGGEVKKPNHEAEAAHVMGQASKRRMTHDEYMNQPDSGYSDTDKAEIREGIKKQQLPNRMAEGGEVEDHDTELSHVLGKELMGAFEAKDHKKLMSSLEACVLHCMSKSDPEEE